MSFIADFRLALLLIVRARLWVVVAMLDAVVAAAAWLSAEFSPRQPMTVALDVGLSLIRVGVPLLALLQVQDLLAREVDRRLILASLTYPRSRSSFLLARYMAVVAVTAGLTLLAAAVLAAVVSVSGGGYQQATPVALGLPYLLTIAYLLLDIAVIVAFGVALATVATTPNLVFLGGIGFMIIARSTSTIVDLLGREKHIVQGTELYHQGLQSVQWLIPDLAALDVRPIALYDKMELLPQSPWALVLMALAYTALLLIMGCLCFERRQFT